MNAVFLSVKLLRLIIFSAKNFPSTPISYEDQSSLKANFSFDHDNYHRQIVYLPDCFFHYLKIHFLCSFFSILSTVSYLQTRTEKPFHQICFLDFRKLLNHQKCKITQFHQKLYSQVFSSWQCSDHYAHYLNKESMIF